MAGDVMRIVDTVMLRPLVWGESDCCLTAGDVFLRLHGIDPVAGLRGRYASVLEACRIIRAAGGMVPLFTGLFAAAGLVAAKGRAGLIGISAPGAAEGPEGRALLISAAPNIWVGKTANGWATRPPAACHLSWGLG